VISIEKLTVTLLVKPFLAFMDDGGSLPVDEVPLLYAIFKVVQAMSLQLRPISVRSILI
jgi:hypothetical protein